MERSLKMQFINRPKFENLEKLFDNDLYLIMQTDSELRAELKIFKMRFKSYFDNKELDQKDIAVFEKFLMKRISRIETKEEKREDFMMLLTLILAALSHKKQRLKEIIEKTSEDVIKAIKINSDSNSQATELEKQQFQIEKELEKVNIEETNLRNEMIKNKSKMMIDPVLQTKYRSKINLIKNRQDLMNNRLRIVLDQFGKNQEAVSLSDALIDKYKSSLLVDDDLTNVIINEIRDEIGRMITEISDNDALNDLKNKEKFADSVNNDTSDLESFMEKGDILKDESSYIEDDLTQEKETKSNKKMKL